MADISIPVGTKVKLGFGPGDVMFNECFDRRYHGLVGVVKAKYTSMGGPERQCVVEFPTAKKKDRLGYYHETVLEVVA